MSLSDQSNILVAVDAELNVLERRVAKLKEIRALALELDNTRLPKASKEPSPQTKAKLPPARPPKTSPPLLASEAMAAARDLLADGPATVAEIHRALDRWPTARTRSIVEASLEELGAVTAGVARGGATRYKLAPEPEPEPPAITTDLDRVMRPDALGLYASNGGS